MTARPPRLVRRSVLLGGAALLATAARARAEDHVFLTYTQSELDRAYDQANWAPDRAAIIARYATDSAMVRRAIKPRTESYGPTAAETLDIFAPRDPGRAPIHVFIHGGAWLSLSKDDASAPAPTFLDMGAIYIALGFANIPAVRLPNMVDQCRRALAWIHTNAASFGGNADAIHISGHSSGGHLAAVMLTTDWTSLGKPADLVKSALLLSGVYDLYPAMLSSRRNYLKLTSDECLAFSPMRHLDRVHCPVAVSVGDEESPEFKRQAQVMGDALAGMGLLRLRATQFNQNHFQMPEQLNRPDSPLGRIALSMMGLT